MVHFPTPSLDRYGKLAIFYVAQQISIEERSKNDLPYQHWRLLDGATQRECISKAIQRLDVWETIESDTESPDLQNEAIQLPGIWRKIYEGVENGELKRRI